MTHRPTRILQTERLLIRQFTLDDLEELRALVAGAAAPGCLSGISAIHIDTRDELAGIIEEYGRFGFGLWAALDIRTGAFVGCCGLRPCLIEAREEVEIVCALAPRFPEKGLATEAARAILRYGIEHLHVGRIICLVRRENRAAVATVQETGLVFERAVDVAGQEFLLYAASLPALPIDRNPPSR